MKTCGTKLISLILPGVGFALLGTGYAQAVPSGVPGVFNAFDMGAPLGSVTGFIQTRIAAHPFNLDIVALKGRNNEKLNTGYKGKVLVELVDASSGAACSGLPVSVSVGPFTFGKNNKGRLTVSNIQFADARANLRVRISELNGKGGINTKRIACSTDNFALRPAYFRVAVTDADWQTAGMGRALNNAMAAGGIAHKAGQPFSVTGAPVNAAGQITSMYNSTPSLAATDVLLPAGGKLGTLAADAWSVTNGVAVSNNVTYSEVGAFALQMTDALFSAVDAADGTPSCQRTIGTRCDAGNNPVSWVPATASGRFVPDHFVVTTNNVPVFNTFNDAACATRSFTYIGQAFGYVTPPQARITAMNAAGVTTANYSGSLWKLVAGDVTQIYSPLPPASPTLDTGLVGLPNITANNDGTGTATVRATDVLAFSRTLATPQAPFHANISLSLSVADSSEAAVAGNGAIRTLTPAVFNGGGSGIVFNSGNAFRYGRLKLANAHGSELLDLAVPMEAQYWNGTAFLTNTADHCTRLTAAQITLGGYKKNLVACEAVTSLSGRFSAGKSKLKLIKPGAGNNGSVDVTVNLGTSATGNSCAPVAAPAIAADQSYLQGNWAGSGFDQNPRARATFGVYKNSNEFIFLREMY